MTEVFINNSRVFPDLDKQALKITMENPFFENKGSYSLDLSFPLSIEDNVKVFGKLNRLDVTKGKASFDAMIVAENVIVFKGAAKVTKVDNKSITIQLLAGNSRVWFWSKFSDLYIDEMEYEFHGWELMSEPVPQMEEAHSIINSISCFKENQFIGVRGEWAAVPVYNEAEDNAANYHHVALIHWKNGSIKYILAPSRGSAWIESSGPKACQPNLMYIFKSIVRHLGYELHDNSLAGSFAENIYIATTNTSKSMFGGRRSSNAQDDTRKIGWLRMALPHWTVEEFILQFQNFFNVTVRFDDVAGAVDIVEDNHSNVIRDISGNVVEEFSCEIKEDEDSDVNLADSNVAYARSESEYHELDMVDEEVLGSFGYIEKDSYEEIIQDYNASPADALRKVWVCPSGMYIANPEGQPAIIQINHFGKLWRNKEGDDVELKITPCATAVLPAITLKQYSEENKKPIDNGLTWGTTVLCMCNELSYESVSSVYDAIINGEKVEKPEKSDLMQVFFVDDKTCKISLKDSVKVQYPEPYTDYRLNCVENHSLIHERWSLALANSDASQYIGRLHGRSRQQNRNAEYMISFYSENIPSPYDIYMVSNKRYVCKKLEVTFTARGMSHIVVGYFTEIL